MKPMLPLQLQIPWTEQGYPPPEPPQKTKREIFNLDEYADIDKHASKVFSVMVYYIIL